MYNGIYDIIFQGVSLMTAEKDPRKPSLLDSLIGELMNTADSRSLVDLCISGNRKQIAAIPLRNRLIALGFIKKMSLEELNRRLLENNCEILYARSLWEATLIYAFRNEMSYTEWKEMLSECQTLNTAIREGSTVLSEASVSMNDIAAYVSDNSIPDQEIARTRHKTQILSEKISEIGKDKQSFHLFLLSNAASFSTVREKTRYYFCKYLHYFLTNRMEEALTVIKNGRNLRDVWDTLSVFRIRTALDRKKHTPEEAREKITGSPISFGAVYDAFEQFYFGYITQDWLQVLLNYYGDITKLAPVQKKQLTAEARRRSKELRDCTDDEVIEWLREETERKEREADQLYSADNKKAVYQRGRSGENFLRKVIRGETDTDRLTFIAFLLFFGMEARTLIPEEYRIGTERLNTILQECGFPVLDTRRASDRFFIDFLNSGDPLDLLIEEAETMAFSEENFYLYKTYLSSESSDKKWNELTS